MLLSTAFAMDPAPVLARLDEIAPLRAQRVDKRAPRISRDTWIKAAERESVQTGLIEVEGEKAKKAWAVAVLDVPIGRLWAAINDDKSKPNYSSLDYAEVFTGGICGAPRRVFQFLPIGMGVTDRWWIIDVKNNPKLNAASHGRLREQSWETDGDWTVTSEAAKAWAAKGMHITKTYGAWLLIDLDGKHTMVEYYTFADVGGSLPAGFASWLASRNIADTFESMTVLAKKGPTCKIVPPSQPTK